jgi:hypothetical protein
MPFNIAIDKVEYFGAETVITGHVVDGAYAGNEYLLVPLQNGSQIRTVEARHYFNHLSGWPIQAKHQTEIMLHIPWQQDYTAIDESAAVIGIGPLEIFDTRIDVSHVMQDARFWARHLQELLPRPRHPREGYWLDDDGPPEMKYFGLDSDSIASYRRDGLDAGNNIKATPFIRVNINKTQYVELEFNTGLEDRECFWLADNASMQKAMIGYKSRTNSLPALRVEELMRLIQLGLGESGMTLLLLTACYVEEVTDELLALTTRLLSALPGVIADQVGTMAEKLLEQLMLLETEWYKTVELDWVNKAPMSQRNPNNPLSQLTPVDYAFIRTFFEGTA